MFYRRKIILALLQIFDGQLEKIRLQKLLFLFNQSKEKPEYSFIPYRFGCYSYSANADMTVMVRKGILYEDDKKFEKLDQTDYLNQIKQDDFTLLSKIKSTYGKMNATDLMRYTYMNYPFYAIKSQAKNILTEEEWDTVHQSRTIGEKTVLFTIGYESISLEEYLVRLLKNDVKVLIDVRNNPLSMKYGFSKKSLKKYCNSLSIEYVHIPEVGIKSDQRRALQTQSDYDQLFEAYRENNLTKTIDSQLFILDLLKQHKRIALTCFEANVCQCHRKHLSEAIGKLAGFDYELNHI